MSCSALHALGLQDQGDYREWGDRGSGQHSAHGACECKETFRLASSSLCCYACISSHSLFIHNIITAKGLLSAFFWKLLEGLCFALPASPADLLGPSSPAAACWHLEWQAGSGRALLNHDSLWRRLQLGVTGAICRVVQVTGVVCRVVQVTGAVCQVVQVTGAVCRVV